MKSIKFIELIMFETLLMIITLCIIVKNVTIKSSLSYQKYKNPNNNQNNQIDVNSIRFKALVLNKSSEGSTMNKYDYKNIVLNQNEISYYASDSPSSPDMDMAVNTSNYLFTQLLSDISLPCNKNQDVCLYGELVKKYKREFVEINYDTPKEISFNREDINKKCLIIVNKYLNVVEKNTIICHEKLEIIVNIQVEISKRIRDNLFREGETSATYQGQIVKILINPKKITVMNNETKADILSIDTDTASYANSVDSCPISRKESSAYLQRKNSPNQRNNNSNFPKFKSVINNFRKFRKNTKSKNTLTQNINNNNNNNNNSLSNFHNGLNNQTNNNYTNNPNFNNNNNNSNSNLNNINNHDSINPNYNNNYQQNGNQPLQCQKIENEGCTILFSKQNEDNKYVFCSDINESNAIHKSIWSSRALTNQINPKILNIRYEKSLKALNKSIDHNSIPSDLMQPIADKFLMNYRAVISDNQKKNDANPQRRTVDTSKAREEAKNTIITDLCKGSELCMNGLKYMIKNNLINLNDKDSEVSMTISNKYHELTPKTTYKLSGVSRSSLGGNLVKDVNAFAGQSENLFVEELNIQASDFPNRYNILEAIRILKGITQYNSKNYNSLNNVKSECLAKDNHKTQKLTILAESNPSDMFMSYLSYNN